MSRLDPLVRHIDLCAAAALERALAGVEAMIGGEATAQFPFLADLRAALQRSGPGTWDDDVAAFEHGYDDHLPLRALSEHLALDARARALVLAVGFPEEDARFAALFDALQGTPGGRPTLGTLQRWWGLDWPGLRPLVHRLVAAGVLDVAPPDAPGSVQVLRIPPSLWAALRGDPMSTGPVAHRPRGELASLADLVLTPDESERLRRALPLLARGRATCLVIRGHRANGRRTLAGAVARELGRSVLDVDATRLRPDDPAWRSLGALATALHATPVLRVDPAPGERVALRELHSHTAPVVVTLGLEGAVEGPLLETALTLTRAIPGPETRRELWQRLLDLPPADLDVLAARHRLTSGTLVRLAALARLCAATRTAAATATATPPAAVTVADVAAASAELPRDALELLTVHVPVDGDWSTLSLPRDTMQELRTLERWCLRREQLRDRTGPALRAGLRPGVRALLQGPSGTGKTLAARTLASVLGKQLYRVELAAIVNKYIGETEKNLHIVFTRAEEMDIVLLLDEGDALMGRRTAVQSSNDRYANLETNYLLQRLESFQGILVVTTNAADHIDPAFARRMDVVVEFRAPDLPERHDLWRLHLPECHAIEPSVLREVVARCALGGGQIRNAALHAVLLAVEDDDSSLVHSHHLEEAVFREYRKSGMVCPLRRRSKA